MSLTRRKLRKLGIRAAWAGAIVLLATGTGCHSLPMPGAANPLASADKADAAAAGAAGAAGAASPHQHAEMIQIEFRADGGRPERKAMPLQGEMHVQDVMQKSGGFRRFGRAQIELARKTPTGNAHKMKVSYDRSSLKVDPQTDYQVKPGDLLIITEDPTNIFTDMLEGAGVPIGNPAVKHMISG